jgi:tetratricopeptide (TPR) repeat protein
LERGERRALLDLLDPLPGRVRAYAERLRRLQTPADDLAKLTFVAHGIQQPQPPPRDLIQRVMSLLDDDPERELLRLILERLGYTVDPALPDPLPERINPNEVYPEIHAAIAEQFECMADRALIRPTFAHWKAAGEPNRAAQFLNRAAALGSSRENWVQERAWLLDLQDWLLEERGWLLGQTLDDTTAELNILELTRLLLARGQPRQVIERLETLFRKALWTSDQRRIVFIQGELTANFINQADYLRARHVLLAMLRATERAHDKSGQAFALLNLALVANWSPETAPAEAFDLAQRALALYNAIESHPYAMPIWKSRADCLAVLAQIHRKQGNTGEACRLEAQIRKLAEEHHDEHREYEAESYSREGFHLRATGRYREALACYNRALQLHSRHSRRLASLQLAHRANLFVDTDHFFDALRDYEEARQVAHTLQDWRTYATITSNLGIAHLRQGDWREALRLQEEAIAIVQTHQFPRSLVTILTAKAETLLAGALWDHATDLALLAQAAATLHQALDEAAVLLRISVPPVLAESYTALRAWPDTPDYELQAPGEYVRQGFLVIRWCVTQQALDAAQGVINGLVQSGTLLLPQRAKIAIWQGMLLAVRGVPAEAALCFRQAIRDAQRMLDFEAAYYPAQYDLALARAGLILVDKDPKAQLRRAQAEYRKAFNWCDAAGVLQDARAQLAQVGALLDPKGVLEPLLNQFPLS